MSQKRSLLNLARGAAKRAGIGDTFDKVADKARQITEENMAPFKAKVIETAAEALNKSTSPEQRAQLLDKMKQTAEGMGVSVTELMTEINKRLNPENKLEESEMQDMQPEDHKPGWDTAPFGPFGL